jgi:periplasmic divalent cation tolerance protein
MLVAWTSVATAAQAESLAEAIIEKGLAVCVQVEGPIRSWYRWEGRLETAEEYRLCIKLQEFQQTPLEVFINAHHPYRSPEWVVVRAEHVGEKYLSWAIAVPTSSTL